MTTSMSAPTREALTRAAQAALSCAQTCNACASACLGEEQVIELRHCIALDLDCAQICDTLAGVLARDGGAQPALTRAMLETCIQACRACGQECAEHASTHEHCRVCAEACRLCEDACRDALTQLAR